MGERYYITGVQIGMMLAYLKLIETKLPPAEPNSPSSMAGEIEVLLDEIQAKQFIGTIPTVVNLDDYEIIIKKRS